MSPWTQFQLHTSLLSTFCLENWDLFWQYYLDKTTFANKTRCLPWKKKIWQFSLDKSHKSIYWAGYCLLVTKNLLINHSTLIKYLIQSLASLCPPVLNYHITQFPHSWSVPLLKIFAVFIGCWQLNIQTSSNISFLTSPDSDTMWKLH